LFVLLLGCITRKETMYIDILEKPKAELPDSILKIIVVNNAVPQPLTVDTRYNNAEVDSALRSVFEEVLPVAVNRISCVFGNQNMPYVATTDYENLSPLALSILTSRKYRDETYFEDVSYYGNSVRTENGWKNVAILDSATRIDLLDEGFGAVFTLDRLLFLIDDDNKIGEYVGEFPRYFDNIKITALLSAAVYTRDSVRPACTVTVIDSIRYTRSLDRALLSPTRFHQTLRSSLLYLAETVAERAANHLLPQWKSEKRTYYTNAAWYSSANLNNGSAMVRHYSSFFNKANMENKARLAINISIGYELADDFDNALKWALLSKELYSSIYSQPLSKNHEQEMKTADDRIKTIKARISAAK